ncbi:replication-associated recombination protein A [Hydrotalea sandarakina]|jgi:putative ATPase|uniref:Replication-associated recombination protein A n=1 Tax=Hydrotalea sandarakina TaxID=1004304 RepID=A0A2W7RVK2_9BACT|nr:replication-associated recombination protein A [Hydrotalea sandarakina]PZX64728.1 putative ATPase [Hydrotalea sandarakina]
MNNMPPLAERMRPKTLHDLYGQQHLTGDNSILNKSLQQGYIPSMILWGPPGVGKTTLAQIIAQTLQVPFFQLSAISSGVKEVREVIDTARKTKRALLFIDEIHRFNKSQQDALLAAVEQGIITLIGATTENPSFEVNAALLSRCQVYILKPLQNEDLLQLLQNALEKDDILKQYHIRLQQTDALLQFSGGDARKLLNLFELVVLSSKEKSITITNEMVNAIAQQKTALYDKGGEQHYDIISAFIKSMRGSDPNAAVYWLARMIEGGEDVSFIARRMIIFASEDIGNANPNALLLANATFDAVNKIGYPESRIILSQCATYLAGSPKSNAAYEAINNAQQLVQTTGDLPVPLHLHNAPTRLMKNLDYGKAYQYPHQYPLNFVEQEYLPTAISGTTLYQPGNNAREVEIRKFLQVRWKNKYGY